MPRNVTSYGTFTADRIVLTSNTASTNSTTGALVIPGGLGLGGNLNVGGTLTAGAVVYASTSSGTFAVTDGTGTTFTVASTTESTSVGSGSATFAGGVSIAGNLYVGGNVVAGAITYASTSTGTLAVTDSPGTTVVISSTTDSTTQADGSTTLAGGMGVAKRINAGSLKVFDTTQSSSTITGSIIAGGGIGLAGNLVAGGSLTGTVLYSSAIVNTGNTTSGGFDFIFGNTDQVTRGNSGQSRALVKNAGATMILNFAGDFTGGVVVQGSTQSTSPTTGAFRVDTGAGINGNLYVGGVINGATSITGTSLVGQTLSLNATTDSTSIGTGNLITLGGISVAKNISTDTLKTYNATNSTSTSTGAIVITGTGGLGVAGNAYIGGVMNSATITSGAVTCASVNSSGAITGTTVTGSTLVSSGNVNITGTMTAANAAVAGTSTLGTINATTTNTSTLAVSSGTDSTSTTTGATTMVGGLGVAKNISALSQHLYGSTNSTSKTTGTGIIDGGLGVALNISSGSLRIYDTTNSTSYTTGAIVCDGSVGVAGKVWAGGNITNGGFDFILGNTDQATRGDSGASRAIIKDFGNELGINFQGEFTGGTRIDSKLRILSDAEAATLTSSLYTLGGIRAEKNIWSTASLINGGTDFILGNTLTNGDSGQSRALVKNPSATLIINFDGDFTGGVVVQGTTDATSPISGAFRVNGGASVEKNLWVGEEVTATNLLYSRYNITRGDIQVVKSNVSAFFDSRFRSLLSFEVVETFVILNMYLDFDFITTSGSGDCAIQYRSYFPFELMQGYKSSSGRAGITITYYDSGNNIIQQVVQNTNCLLVQTGPSEGLWQYNIYIAKPDDFTDLKDLPDSSSYWYAFSTVPAGETTRFTSNVSFRFPRTDKLQAWQIGPW